MVDEKGYAEERELSLALKRKSPARPPLAVKIETKFPVRTVSGVGKSLKYFDRRITTKNKEKF